MDYDCAAVEGGLRCCLIKMYMKPRLLFVHENEVTVQDGLWAALRIMEKDFLIQEHNLRTLTPPPSDYDVVLGWGAFGSRVDAVVSQLPGKRALCIGGTAGTPDSIHAYQVVFFETYWDLDTRLSTTRHPHLVHAFGVNTDIYRPLELPKVWDYLTVGAFAAWKRQFLLEDKPGLRLAVGQIQKNNLDESLGIIGGLLGAGVAISDMVPAEKLALLYNLSRKCYIPADINGGGERAILEARACGIPVEIAGDNPKNFELVTTPVVWDHHYYADQLTKGIQLCLGSL